MDIRSEEKLLFVGDSITDCESKGMAKPLGFGYVQFIASILTLHEPEAPWRVLNQGVSGDTILDLELRWERDVIQEKPDWMFMMIGVNDVINRHQDDRQHLAVDDDSYERTYRKLIGETLERLSLKIVLMEPSCLGVPLHDKPNQELKTIAEIVNRVGADFDLPVLPVFQRLSSLVDKEVTCGMYLDPTHPYMTGHLIITHLVCEQLGIDLNLYGGKK